MRRLSTCNIIKGNARWRLNQVKNDFPTTCSRRFIKKVVWVMRIEKFVLYRHYDCNKAML